MPSPLRLDDVIDAGLRAVYQPLVRISTGELVGYEALARGPEGTIFESPLAMFDAAAREGKVPELDWACRRAAVLGVLALDERWRPTVFVNIEPTASGIAPDPTSVALLDRAMDELRMCVEVTERELVLRPAELLKATDAMRRAGCGIVLDDVGADARSLALLPLLRPDVVKLDMRLLRSHPNVRVGEIINGVRAYAESTGAEVLAEGIEDEGDVTTAIAMGATIGQGWHFGRPGPLPASGARPMETSPPRFASRRTPDSPMAAIRGRRPLISGSASVLLSITLALEAEALRMNEHAIVISTFQDVTQFTGATAKRYEELAASVAFTAVIGAGMPAEPAPGVRGGSLDADDVVANEWDVAVLSPHFAGALVATGVEERQFEYALTFDRELVVDIVSSLTSRVLGLPAMAGEDSAVATAA